MQLQVNTSFSSQNTIDWYSFSSQGFFSVSFVFFFCDIFFQNYLRRIFFKILSWLEFNFVIKLNHVGKKHCSFAHIELFVNYNYKSLQIRLNHMGKHCSFHHKTLWIATVFTTLFFFSFFGVFFYFFSKIISVDFFFLILS